MLDVAPDVVPWPVDSNPRAADSQPMWLQQRQYQRDEYPWADCLWLAQATRRAQKSPPSARRRRGVARPARHRPDRRHVQQENQGAPHRQTNFGELLRSYRQAAGLTQQELAERAGLSVHGIQKLERGTTHPYRDTANRLELALHLSPDASARLRDAARPARRHPTAPVETVSRHNLPNSTTTFIPRAGEIDQVVQRLRVARLLTITGFGKTRLATEVARDLVDQFADGVWLVDLSQLAEPRLILQSIATAIDVREVSNQAPLDTLIDHLRSRCLLLVLDNCEHVVDAVAHVIDELRAARVR